MRHKDKYGTIVVIKEVFELTTPGRNTRFTFQPHRRPNIFQSIRFVLLFLNSYYDAETRFSARLTRNSYTSVLTPKISQQFSELRIIFTFSPPVGLFPFLCLCRQYLARKLFNTIQC